MIEDFHIRTTRDFLASSARLLERSLRGFDMADERNHIRIDSLCKDIGALTGTRATVVLASGKVVGDSEEKPSSMENHRDRPEISSALSGSLGVSKRFSDTMRRRELYVAVPMIRGDRVVAAVRVSKPLVAIDSMLREMRFRIALTAAIAAILAGIASYALSRRFGKPLDEIKHGLERFTRDDLSYRLPFLLSTKAATFIGRPNSFMNPVASFWS